MVALLAWKFGGSIGWFFFSVFIYLFILFKIRLQKKYNIIHVCEFLGKQSLRIGLILVLEGVVFYCIWLKYLLEQLLYILTFYFEHFCLKYTELSIKNFFFKKLTLVFWYFGSVGKGQTNICFLFFFFFFFFEAVKKFESTWLQTDFAWSHHICVRKSWNFNYFLKIQKAISKTTAPILGLFVLIWMHFSCLIQI